MKQQIKKRMLKLLSATLICTALTGCSQTPVQLSTNRQIKIDEIEMVNENTLEKYNDFTFNLFKKTADENNTVLSPLSLSYVLAMTESGADHETLKQIENMLGITKAELDSYTYTFNSESVLKNANSIWFKNDKELKVNDDFLSEIISKYQTDVYKTDFNSETLNDINEWVKEKTDGKIPEIVENLDINTKIILLNALALEAKWENPFQILTQDQKFYSLDQSVHTIPFMSNKESSYIEDDNAIGIVKEYKNSNLEFIALLPKGDFNNYIQQLSYEEIKNMLENKIDKDVYVSLPKFKVSDEMNLNQILSDMGMHDAFDANNADFKKMATSGDNLYIGQIIQKTYFSVDEDGTEAFASTIESMFEGCGQGKEINFNKPFVYMVIDKTNHSPVFMGTITNL